MSVMDAIAMAGGATPTGNPKKIELLRDGKRISADISLHSRLLDSRLQSGDQLRIPQRSWLSRNTTVLAAGITAAALITTAIIRP
jgi:protein involved in polysaccharide export with SLBB domain